MKKILLFILPLCLLLSCSTSKKVTNTSTPNNKEISMEQDGSSFTKAIIINEKTETEGVNAEYIWLKQHYPGYKLKKQILSYNSSKPYDIMEIITSEGENKSVYFDISHFFGKY